MALPLATAFVRIKPELSRFQSETDAELARANIGGLGRKHGTLFGKAFSGAFKSTLAVAGVGIAAALGSADLASKFQSQMTKIRTQAGGTAKDVQVLGNQVLRLGTYAEQGPQQLAQALYHLKSLGMDNVQAMKA